MKTIRIKIYKFEELNKDAQQNAIDNFRENGIDTDFIYNEAYNTVKAFNQLFNTKEGNRSWLDVYTDHIEDSILELTGFRLKKYINNNFGSSLFKNQYLKHGKIQETEVKFWHPMRKYKVLNSGPNKGKFSLSYYSNWKKDNSCVLTGVCYDEDILQAIYDFLLKRDFKNDSTTFYHLLNECFYRLKKSIENEVDYQNTYEAIKETILANDYDFLSNGKQY